MAKTATLTWDLPTVRESGNPLDFATIDGTEVALGVDGGPDPTVLKLVLPADVQEHVVGDIDTGDWAFRLVVVDTSGRRGPEVFVPFSVDETAPGPVSNPQVTLS